MPSSGSELEPELVQEQHETLGSTSTELHRIKTRDAVEIVLTRIPPSDPGNQHGTPVLLVHGNFSNRGFWISPKGIGLAPFLSCQGFDAWVVELRGHGLSSKGPAFSSITAEDHIKKDLPAAVRYVSQTRGRPIFLVGHSAGGIFVAASLALGDVDPAKILGAALFGAQISMGEGYLKIPPVAWLSCLILRLLGRVPAPKLGLGPEPEPAGEMLEFVGWKKLGGKWVDSERSSYWEALQKVTTPVLAVSGARDRDDPPKGCRKMLEAFGSPDKRFVLLSCQEGFCQDYEHIGMIVSKEAQEEVWPLLAQWMDERKSP